MNGTKSKKVRVVTRSYITCVRLYMLVTVINCLMYYIEHTHTFIYNTQGAHILYPIH